MDMEGRPLGTERPSVSVASNGASGERFQALLAARAEASEQGVEASMEDDFAARITEGRTDAAQVESDVRDAVRRRPEGETRATDAGPRDAASRNDRGDDGGRAVSRRASEGDARAGGNAADGDALSGEERGRHLTNASDAEGAAEESTDAPPTAPVQVAPDARPIGLEASLPRAQAAVPVALPGAVGPALLPAGAPAAGAASQRPPAVAPVGATEGAGSTGTRRAAPSAAARSNAGERAEAILDQLRAHIRTGAREATLHLRPGDLGRIQMRVRVEGGGVQASIAAESIETLRVLEAHAPELRAWLAKDAGGPVELELGLLDAAPGDASDGATDRGLGRGQADARSGERGPGGGAQTLASAASTSVPEALRTALRAQNTDGVDLVA